MTHTQQIKKLTHFLSLLSWVHFFLSFSSKFSGDIQYVYALHDANGSASSQPLC